MGRSGLDWILTSTLLILQPGGFHARFDGAIGPKILNAQIDTGFGGHVERPPRNEADQLGAANGDSVFGGEFFDAGKDLMGWGGLVVSQVDGDLRGAFGGK